MHAYGLHGGVTIQPEPKYLPFESPVVEPAVPFPIYPPASSVPLPTIKDINRKRKPFGTSGDPHEDRACQVPCMDQCFEEACCT